MKQRFSLIRNRSKRFWLVLSVITITVATLAAGTIAFLLKESGGVSNQFKVADPPVLTYGENLVRKIRNISNDMPLSMYESDKAVTSIVFGKTSEYESEISGIDGVPVDTMGAGRINLYRVPHTDDATKFSVYILSNETIMGNQDTDKMFYGLKAVTSIEFFNYDTSQFASYSYIGMFSSLSSLTRLNLSSWNTSNATNMSKLFYQCSNLITITVSDGWDTSNVTNSADMFNGCTSLIGSAGTAYNSSYIDKTYAHIDGGKSNPGYLSTHTVVLKTGKEINAAIMGLDSFDANNYAENVKQITIGKVSDYSDEVSGVAGVPVDENGIGNIMLYRVQDAADSKFKIYILSDSIIKTNTDASYMFQCLGLQQIIGLEKLNTSNTVNMSHMFEKMDLPSLDISTFYTSNVTDMSYMFNAAYLENLNLSGVDTKNVTDMNNMFYNCDRLTSLDVSGFDTSKVTNMANLFGNCKKLTSLDVSGFDTRNVTDMSGMFSGCSILTSLDVSSFDTRNVTDMSLMFNNCKKLTSLDVTGFDTASVVNMRGMFRSYSLTSLDLSSFDTRNVTNMSEMFNYCGNLVTIYAGDTWSVENVSVGNDAFMFGMCQKLVGGKGTTFSGSTKNYAHIDEGPSNPGYFTNCAYQVTYDANGGTGAPAEQTIVSSDASYTITLSSTKPTKSNYIFMGWAEAPNATTAKYQAGDQITLQKSARSIKLYAVWSAYSELITGSELRDKMLPRKGSGSTVNEDTTAIIFGKTEDYASEVNGVTGIAVDKNGTGSIKLYRVPYTSGSSKFYKAYILSDKLIVANADSANMFSGAVTLNQVVDLSNLSTSRVTNMEGMFTQCDLRYFDLSQFDTSQVTIMDRMFSWTSNSASGKLDLSNFDMSNVTSTMEMFYRSTVTNFILGYSNKASLLSTYGMFQDSSAKVIDLSGLDTKNVTNMSFMFDMYDYGGYLRTVYVGEKWSTASVDSIDGARYIFRNCNYIVGGAGTTFNGYGKIYARIDGGPDNPGYFTKK